MRSITSLLQSLGSAGALQNARAELELTQSRRVQAAVVARHVGSVDAIAGRPGFAVPARPVAVPDAA